MGHSGRLRSELLDRAVGFGQGMLGLVDELQRQRRPARLIDQLAGCDPGAGAQLFEANEAASRRDFIKTLTWAAKELSETTYWLRIIRGMAWVSPSRLDPLEDEAQQLLRITKSMIARSRAADGR